MARVFLLVLDGAPDRPNAVLGGRTPFQAACTPGLDALASSSQHGMLTVIGPGIWPESDSGAMALLSYDPLVYYTGRGPLEGHGLGLVQPGLNSAAFRVNFASFDRHLDRLDRRTARGLGDPELQALAGAVEEGVSLAELGTEFALTAYSRHRGILTFASKAHELSGQVSNTDPGFRNEGSFSFPVAQFEPRPLLAKPRVDTAAARFTAQVVNAFVERSGAVLDAHPVNARRRARGELPANLLLVRDGGDTPRPLPRFADRFQRSVSMFGQIPAEAGLAALIGAEFTYSRQAPEEEEPTYLRRALNEVLAAETDLVFIHLKGPDEPGHDKRPLEKTRAIEAIDEHFVQPLLARIDDRDVVAVTSDHATPCELGIHSDDPVPVMVRRPDTRPDGIERFSEVASAKGRLQARRAVELVPLLLGPPR